jgi:Patatin-like phospholipase
MLDEHTELCRTFVVSISLRSQGDIATRMRTYDILTEDAFRAHIWEAARATSAAPTFFAPISIEDITYGDGGTGWNNPTTEAIDEAHNIWSNRPIGCVVSIGTGLEDPNQLNEHSEKLPKFLDGVLRITSPRLEFSVALAEYCVKCLTTCEKIHQQVAKNPERIILNGNYFRLNVPGGMSKIGLGDWDKSKDMIALSDGYMKYGDMVRLKLAVAKLLLKPESASQSS